MPSNTRPEAVSQDPSGATRAMPITWLDVQLPTALWLGQG